MTSRIGMKIKSMNLKNRKATNNIYKIIHPSLGSVISVKSTLKNSSTMVYQNQQPIN
jgi:hypothetical protein